MPQGLTTPTWYNDDTYIKDKVTECNVIRFGDAEQLPWTAESVRSFLAAANGEEDYQPWMGYDNFVSNGNAENCSPNPLFNVMQYLTAKANQLNAMDEGAGYEGNNAWTAESVLRYFNDHHITAWDHFTTAGQFENVNPSNAMDLSDFFERKAAQCSAMEFDGKSDWSADDVKDYFRANGLNAVEVAGSASDPNVVAVPQDEAVTVPAGETPWGLPQLNTVNLEVGKADVVSDGGMPTNFVGTVETSNAKSSFNPDDQITGTTDGDILTVTMNSGFSGMNKGGFVKGVSTVDLTNGSTNDLTFNANGIEGASTYNIKGNIGLDNLDATGLTVNLANVNTSQGLTIDYAPGVTAGPDDYVTFGLNNVYQPNTNTDQPSKAVDINSTGIEHVTVNSTGPVTNIVNLTGVNYMNSLVVEGDARLDVRGVDAPLATIDASKAEAAVNIDATGAKQITGAQLGEGNDTLTVTNILPSATINGGAGSDNLVLQGNSGTFNFDMTDVETTTIAGNNGVITLNGADIEDMTNLNLDDTSNGIILTDFNTPEINVQATNANTSDLQIADITNVKIRVGDGDETTKDSWADTNAATRPVNISLGETSTITIDATDTIRQGATFVAELDAAKASNLNLNAGTDSRVELLAGSDLNNITQIDATGTGAILIDAGSVVGVDSKQLIVNTTQMDSGNFTANFANHTSGAGNLDVQGSGMTNNSVTVDGSYSRVNMNTGMGQDTLVLNCGEGKAWTAAQLTGDLGADTADRVIVNGKPFEVVNGQTVWSDFSGLKGVDTIIFTDPAAVTDDWATAAAGTATAGTVILLPAGLTGASYDPTYDVAGTINEFGTQIADQFDIAIPHGTRGTATYGGNGGTDTFSGYVNSVNENLTLQGQRGATDGAVDVSFGNGPKDLNVMAVDNLTIRGGELENTVTGQIGSSTNPVVDGDFVMNNVMNNVGGDNVNLAVYAKGDVTMQGAGGKNNAFAATASSESGDVIINSGAANQNGVADNAGAYVEVVKAADDVVVTTGTGNDVLVLNDLAAAAAAPGGTDATARNFTVNMGTGEDTVQIEGNVNLTNWQAGGTVNADGVFTGATATGAAFTGVETINIADNASLNLGGLTAGDAKFTGDGSLVIGSAAYNLANVADFAGDITINAAANANITLTEGADTVVLGQGVTAAAAQQVVISGFDVNEDRIDLAGFMDGFAYQGDAPDAEYGSFAAAVSFDGTNWASEGVSGAASDIAVTGPTVGGDSAAGFQYTASVTVTANDGLDNKGIYNLDDPAVVGTANISALFNGASAVVEGNITAPSNNNNPTEGTISGGSGDIDGKLYIAASDAAILLTSDGAGGTNLWYIHDSSTDGINAAGDILLIGTLTGVAVDTITATNFA